MTIFTTEAEGLLLDDIDLLDEWERNQGHIEAWQERKAAYDLDNTPLSGWQIFARITVGTVAAILIAAWITLAVTAWWALENAHVGPETRTFTNHIDQTTYQRTQRDWGVAAKEKPSD